MRIFLARHGETDWNRAQRVQGSIDTELNDIVIAQAEELASHILSEGYRFDALYSSPQKRALRTAEIIGERIGLDIRTDRRLMEINFGKFQGHNWKEIEALYPEEFRYYSADRWKHPVPEGESHGMLLERALDALRDIAGENSADAEILVVTHGALILAVRCAKLDQWDWESLLNYSIGNASLMPLEDEDLRRMGIIP